MNVLDLMPDVKWIPPADTPCKATYVEGDPWFDIRGTRHDSPRYARDLCHGCPFTAECLTEAMRQEEGKDWKERHGVWGGMLPKERARMAGRAVA